MVRCSALDLGSVYQRLHSAAGGLSALRLWPENDLTYAVLEILPTEALLSWLCVHFKVGQRHFQDMRGYI